MNLKGKNAFVTGGSLGIGKSVVLDLARKGANVAFTYRKHQEEAMKIAEEVKQLGCKSLPIQADISEFQAAQDAVKQAIETFGKLDILVNNAGINWDGVVWKMTEEQWDKVLDINLKGYFNYVRAVAPVFKDQKSGKIINITSINGMRGKFGQTNYSAAKAGIIGFTKAVARELGKFNVNVNAVAPGLIETDMIKDAPQDVRDKALQEIVLGRIGLPEEVAEVVSFLASEAARHITGEVIKVDGGQYI
ncbi:MAG: beta-ketoacyl-ACP reductase [Candidatus Schekmanbacteria bacterium RBG_13_48_7]|uniref:Beta-ketoacyl-ACP reductase n=1 Tax=Candidatus Schekmanbacteria bacterium RBG_13_48_7 TaxID=1817878 RepID=A0A1F7RVJ5_9BACT|nr:MAG: beta-ketoacyl-ACP reductase [Candidatus Schekmanbacteria bacterium RBG_13_48_7]